MIITISRFTLVVASLLSLIMFGVMTLNQRTQGDLLAFASDRSGNLEIYVYDLSLRVMVNISRHPADDSYPQWNSQDNALTYWTQRSGRNDEYLMWSPVTWETTPYSRKSRERISEFSPDEKWFLLGVGGGSGIRIQDMVALRSGALSVETKTLPTGNLWFSQAVWSADSQYVILGGRNIITETYDIYRVEIAADGTPFNLHPLTTHPANDSHPTWIPAQP